MPDLRSNVGRGKLPGNLIIRIIPTYAPLFHIHSHPRAGIPFFLAYIGKTPGVVFVENRNLPALSWNAQPDCCDPPLYSPHSRGMYVTDAGCPNPSCGAAFVSFVYMYSQPQAAATATTTIFRTSCFSWERSSRLVITPRPQPYRPIRPKSRPRNTVAPRGRNGAVDPGDPCHEPRVGLNCSSIDGFRVA